MFFVRKKWQFIFIYDNYINFIYTWGNFDRLIIGTPSAIKVTSSAIKVTPFDGVTFTGLWRGNFYIVTYGTGIELKANYHILIHSVAGACVM